MVGNVVVGQSGGPTSAYLGSCRFNLPEYEANPEMYEKIFALLEELEIAAFFYISGNDSMDTINKLSKHAAKIGSPIRFIGVPKTIDNDLDVTDHTPGFGSAAKYIASVSKELIRDSLVYDQKQITIVEIMGRNAGWLTAAAALAKCEDCEGVDLLYLPELPFDIDKFLEKVERLFLTKKALVVAVSEGIKTADGKSVWTEVQLQSSCRRTCYITKMCWTLNLSCRYYRGISGWWNCCFCSICWRNRQDGYLKTRIFRSIYLYHRFI